MQGGARRSIQWFESHPLRHSTAFDQLGRTARNLYLFCTCHYLLEQGIGRIGAAHIGFELFLPLLDPGSIMAFRHLNSCVAQ